MRVLVPEIPSELARKMTLRWLVESGETVTQGQPILRLENRAFAVDVAAPIAGQLKTWFAANGASVSSGDPVTEIEPLRIRDLDAPDKRPSAASGDPGQVQEAEKRLTAPFVDPEAENAVGDALSRAIQMTMQRNIEKFVAAENMQRLYHGETWSHNIKDADPEPGALTQHSVDLEIKFQDVADNDLNLLPKYIHQVAEGMTSQAVSDLLQVVERSTAKSGNTVSLKEEGSFKAAFLAMLAKIEFSVGRHGEIQRPGMHLSPQMYEKVLPELTDGDEVFRQQVESITRDKEEQALRAEAERIAKFETAKDSQ